MTGEDYTLPAAPASPQPCKIIGASQLDELVVKYLGGARENIQPEEQEILLFALYIESKDRGGLAKSGYDRMEERLRKQALQDGGPDA